LATIKLDASALSRDEEVADRAKNDPLQYFGGVRARTGAEVLVATAELQQQLHKLDFPMFIIHGEKDPLTKYEASELLYKRSPSADKTLKIYPDAKHELFNELNKEEVLADMVGWIDARL
jgi:alpha-beta hydrolase superfamily lysophospholipase